jgi:uncharacterized protein
MLKETIRAKGHPNVTARHRTTFEITKESHLTLQGDCIIAVCADRGLTDFSEEFRKALKSEDALLEIKMVCCGIEEKVLSRGHPDLSFTNHEEMVVRKSVFTCGRTLSIGADRASCDLGRDFIRKLSEGNPLSVELTIIENKPKSG